MLRWLRLLVLGLLWVATACTGPAGVDGPATEVAYFRTSASEIERGAEVRLEWRVDHAGVRAGEASCALLRQVDGAAWEAPIAVACEGSRSDTPPYPAQAASVTYRLRAIDRATAASGGFLTRDLTVAFLTPRITIDPVRASVLTNGTVAFTATVQGTVDTGVAWSTSCGSISGSGTSVTYVAPSFTGSCTVTATSVAVPTASATAEVTVGAVAIAIDPTRVALDQGGARAFSATVTGSVDTSVVWRASSGTISGSGASVAYTAPMAAGWFTVTVASVADPSAEATATVEVREALVTIAPTSATMLSGTTRTFGATLTGVADGALTWSATGGTVTPTGAQATYTAPGDAGTYTVTVASVAQPAAEASATVVVERVAIDLSPGAASVETGATVAFTASVSGTSDARVSWSASCGSISGSGASVTYVAPAFPGTCSVTATSVADPRRSATATVVVAAPPTGEVEWSVAFGSDEHDRAAYVATDGSGDVYVAGTTEGVVGGTSTFPQGATDVFVRKYDRNGVAQWTWQLGTAAADRVLLLAPQPDGDVIVGGTTEGTFAHTGGTPGNLFVARFDAASQTVEWVREFGADVAANTTAMGLDADGNVFAGVTGGQYLVLAKFAPEGRELWRRAYEEVYLGNAARIVLDPAGNAVSTGRLYKFDYVIKVGPDGAVAWTTAGASFYGYHDRGFDVALDAEGGVFAVGHASYGGQPEIGWLSKIDARGVRLWVRDLAPGVDTTATAVAAPADGSALVGGWSAGDLGIPDSGSGAYVVKYTGDGDRLWAQRFASVPNGFASIATDGQGNAYAFATAPGLLDDRPDPDGSGDDLFLVKLAP